MYPFTVIMLISYLFFYVKAKHRVINEFEESPPDEISILPDTELPKMIVFTEPSFETYCTFCPLFGYCFPVRQLGHIKRVFANKNLIDMKELDEFGRKCTTLSCPSDMIFYNSKCVHVGSKRDKYRQIRCPEYDEKVPHKHTYFLNYKNVHGTLYVQKRCIPRDMFCTMQTFENGITLTICDDQTKKVGSRQPRNVTIIVTIGKDETLDDLVIEGVASGLPNKRPKRKDGVQFAIIVHSKQSPNKLTIWGTERQPKEFYDKTLRQQDDDHLILSRIPISMPNGLQAEIREEIKALSSDPYEQQRRKWRLSIYDPVSLGDSLTSLRSEPEDVWNYPNSNRFNNFIDQRHGSINAYEWYLRGEGSPGPEINDFPTFVANVNTDEV